MSLSSMSCCLLCWMNNQSDITGISRIISRPKAREPGKALMPSKHTIGQSWINKLISSVNPIWRVHSHHGSETVTDSLMHPFTNGICLWIFCCNRAGMNIMPVQQLLEAVSSEFTTLIVNTIQTSRVSTQPAVLKLPCYMSWGLILKPLELYKSSDCVNGC